MSNHLIAFIDQFEFTHPVILVGLDYFWAWEIHFCIVSCWRFDPWFFHGSIMPLANDVFQASSMEAMSIRKKHVGSEFSKSSTSFISLQFGYFVLWILLWTEDIEVSLSQPVCLSVTCHHQTSTVIVAWCHFLWRNTLRPKVRLWDLPGAGTSAVPAETYLQEGLVRLEKLKGWLMRYFLFLFFWKLATWCNIFPQVKATCKGFWKLSCWSQDMGLRYFDRVVVVSAGRFTEMEAILGKHFSSLKQIPWWNLIVSHFVHFSSLFTEMI